MTEPTTTSPDGATDATATTTSTDAPQSTLVCVVLDRSGSMQAIKSDVDGGFDAFITAQQAVGGECRVTLNQFDTEYERVLTLVPVADVPALDLQPRGGTALLDAIGRTVTDLQHDLDTRPPDEQPDQIVVVILTDGYENSSVEWTYPAVKQLVESKQPAWQFVFIGADQDAITEGAKLGVDAATSLMNRSSGPSTARSYALLADKVVGVRRGVRVAFTDEERAAAMADDETP